MRLGSVRFYHTARRFVCARLVIIYPGAPGNFPGVLACPSHDSYGRFGEGSNKSNKNLQFNLQFKTVNACDDLSNLSDTA